jgi:hypothetical protein
LLRELLIINIRYIIILIKIKERDIANIKKKKRIIFIVTEFHMKLGVYNHIRNFLLIKFLFNLKILIFVFRHAYPRNTSTLNNDNTILIYYTNLSKASLRRRLLMAPPDEFRCRGADESQASVHSASTLSEYAILSSDVSINPLSRLFFAANIFKAKILEACQKNDFITVIIYFFETLIFLE